MTKGGARTGAGRKPFGARITFDVLPSEQTLIDQKAKKQNQSRSAYLRGLVRKDLQTMDLLPILEEFLSSNDFFDGCKAASRASWKSGSGYSVELFPDGTWRVLWGDNIGNKYETPGVILGLPSLGTDGDYQASVIDGDMTEDDFFLAVFQNDEEDLKKEMRDKLAVVEPV